MTATPWDGVGPKEECLLRVVWAHDGKVEWLHVDFVSADYDWEEDGGYHGNPEQYVDRSGDIRIRQKALVRSMDWTREFYEEGDCFTITHWSPKPVVEDECDACHQLGGNHRPQCCNRRRARIENDVEEGARVG